MTNPNPRPEIPHFIDPAPAENGWKILTTGERRVLINNLQEIRGEINALDLEVALKHDPIVDVSEDSLLWNIVGTIAGDLANIVNILFPEDAQPID